MTGDVRAGVGTALLVLAVLAAVAAVAVVLSGGAASQTASSIELEDPIVVNQDSFTVTVTDLGGVDASNCMRVSKTTGPSPAVITLENFSEGETRTVDRSSVGGYQVGDVISADFGETCSRPTASDSTRVSGYGTASIEDPVIADETSFQVSVTELVSESGDGCVAVENTATGDSPTYFDDVREGDTITVGEDDVGGWSGGEELVARLYDETCDVSEYDVDTTVVEARGDVELEDQIFENQSSFQVSVEELRIDAFAGCVRVDNRAAGSTDLVRVESGETRTVARGDVGGYEQNDEIVATLFSENDCTGSELDTDSAIVFGVPTPTATAAPTATATATQTATPTATATATPSGTPRGGTGGGSTPRFEVTIDDVREAADGGDRIAVDATVENTGQRSDTQTVRLSVDGRDRAARSLSLGSGDSQSVTFTWAESGNDRQLDLQVASEDDSDESAFQLGGDGGSIPGSSGGLLLLLLLVVALLVGYYYVRRRQVLRERATIRDDAE